MARVRVERMLGCMHVAMQCPLMAGCMPHVVLGGTKRAHVSTSHAQLGCLHALCAVEERRAITATRRWWLPLTAPRTLPQSTLLLTHSP